MNTDEAKKNHLKHILDEIISCDQDHILQQKDNFDTVCMYSEKERDIFSQVINDYMNLYDEKV